MHSSVVAQEIPDMSLAEISCDCQVWPPSLVVEITPSVSIGGVRVVSYEASPTARQSFVVVHVMALSSEVIGLDRSAGSGGALQGSVVHDVPPSVVAITLLAPTIPTEAVAQQCSTSEHDTEVR